MVQGYAQKDRRGNSGWQTFGGVYAHASKRNVFSIAILKRYGIDASNLPKGGQDNTSQE